MSDDALRTAQSMNLDYVRRIIILKARVLELENVLSFRGICSCGYDCKDHEDLQIIGECSEHCPDGICQWTMRQGVCKPDYLLDVFESKMDEMNKIVTKLPDQPCRNEIQELLIDIYFDYLEKYINDKNDI